MKANVWLDRRLAQFDRTVRRACTGLIEETERESLAPLSRALHATAARYDEMATELQAQTRDDAEGFPPDPERLVEAEREYRAALLTDIIRPLEDALTNGIIGASIAARWEKAQAALDEQLRRLPKTVRRTEPAALYVGSAGDSVLTRVRKTWVRLGRKFAGESEERKQVIPFRSLSKYHLRARAAALLAALAEDLQQAAAIPVSRLEIAVERALAEVRQVESELDVTAYLVPQTLRSMAPAKDTITSGEINPGAARDTLVNKVRAIGDLFQIAADSSVAELPRDELDQALDLTRDALAKDIEVAGTFMSRPKRRIPPAEGERPTDKARPREERWAEWHRQALARITEMRLLLDFGESIDRLEANVVREVLSESVLDWIGRSRAAADVLRKRGAAALDALDALGTEQREGSAAEIRARLNDTAGYIGEELVGPGSPGTRVRSAAGRAVEELFAEIRSVPESLLLNQLTDPEADSVDPYCTVLVLPLREALEQAFDALVVERLQRAPDSIGDALDASYQEVKTAADVFEYNLSAAIDELGEGDEGKEFVRASIDPVDEEAVDRARDLVANGFEATADAFDRVEEQISDSAGVFIGDWISAFALAWNQVLERVRIRARPVDRSPAVGSQISVGLRTGLRDGQERARKGVSTTLTWVDRAKRIGRRLIRTGRKAVHKPDPSGQGAFPTLSAVRELAAMMEDLPVVYRRLFGFTPVSGALLVGRDSTIVAASRHYGAWKRGLTNPLLITGQPGTGKTSILRQLKEVTLGAIDPTLIKLTEALRSEADVVTLLAETLDIEAPERRTFKALTDLIMALERDDSRVCLVDNLEHLLVRTVGGSLLAKRTITFMSRTDSRVLWIVTMNSYAWQFIERTEGSAAALVVPERIKSLDREQLETAFIARHQRSGLPLRFEIGRKPSALLRRKVRRAGTDERKQTILRSDYFDRLYRASMGDFTLAIFYWLRSAVFDHGDRQVRIRPIRPLDFGYLSRLSRDQTFSLKALLEHRSLTVEDHQHIFDSTFQFSMEIYESLGNAYLIRPASATSMAEVLAFETVREETPYTVGKLMRGPVAQLLRNRHILY